MTNKEVDQILRQTLAPEIPGEILNGNLKKKMEEKSMKYSKKKHFSIKKAAVLAAACCLLMGTVGVASSGKVTTLFTAVSMDNFMGKSFSQLPEAEKKAGFKIKALESFSNGYKFTEMETFTTNGADENGNILERYNEISLDYKKAGEYPLSLYAMEATYARTENRIAKQTADINGVKVSYYVDTYKMVPVGYELTARDKENLQKNDYYISEGAEEISEGQHTTIVWYQDNICYMLITTKGVIPAEELFAMAEELIMS